MNLDRLKKFMALTTSTSDGEALNALRAANRELAENGKTWPIILGESKESPEYRKEYLKLVDEYNALVRKHNNLMRAHLYEIRKPKKKSIFDIF